MEQQTFRAATPTLSQEASVKIEEDDQTIDHSDIGHTHSSDISIKGESLDAAGYNLSAKHISTDDQEVKHEDNVKFEYDQEAGHNIKFEGQFKLEHQEAFPSRRTPAMLEHPRSGSMGAPQAVQTFGNVMSSQDSPSVASEDGIPQPDRRKRTDRSSSYFLKKIDSNASSRQPQAPLQASTPKVYDSGSTSDMDDEGDEDEQDSDEEEPYDFAQFNDDNDGDFAMSEREESSESETEMTSGMSRKRAPKQQVSKTTANKQRKYDEPRPIHEYRDFEDRIPEAMTDAVGLVQDFLHGNIWTDMDASAGRKQQPTFTTGTTERKKAFQQLRKKLSKKARKELDQLNKDIAESSKETNNQRWCIAQKGGWRVKGMYSTLDHYQLAGLMSMRRREAQGASPRGGLLAWQMGLGKTVVTLAMIALDRKLTAKTSLAPTLVVVPSGLVHQWEAEIAKHAMNDVFKAVCCWYSGQKGSRSLNPGMAELMLSQSSIVITTYSDIAASYPDPPESVPRPHFDTRKDKAAWKHHYTMNNLGAFHKQKWHRIVLDEAHIIKNYKSLSSRSCCALNATYRWCLTGTPVQNFLDEFFSYFRFFRLEKELDHRKWMSKYGDPEKQSCVNSLFSKIEKVTIRQTHQSSYLGAKLLDLPKATPNTVILPMSTIEAAIYRIVEKRFMDRINEFDEVVDKASATRQYDSIMDMVYRLRLVTVHPLLVQDCMLELLTDDDFAELHRVLASTRCSHDTDEEIVDRMGAMLAHYGHSTAQRSRKSTTISSSKKTSSCGAKSDMSDWLNLVQEGQRQDRGDSNACPCCHRPLEQPTLISCGHTYSKACLTRRLGEAMLQGSTPCCLVCGANIAIGLTKDPAKQGRKEPSAKKSRASQKTIRDWLVKNGRMLHSTKSLAIKAWMLKVRKQDPQAKIIVYGQFQSTLEVVRLICDIEGWGYKNYDGETTGDQKDHALKAFKTDSRIPVLIATLKCGGVGLNLTEASKVVLLDLWWNCKAEDQAFSRVWRRGQTKETELFRPVVHDSIDEKILNMQEEKSANIAKVYRPDKEDKPTRMELLSLFER